jgi:hypothetical protein
MPRYQHKDLSFEPPSDWLDSTVARFHPPPAPVGAPPVPAITMAYEPLPPGVGARMHADQMLVRLAKTVVGFDFLNREDVTIGDRPAILFRFRFRPDAEALEAMEQTMALVPAGTDRDPRIAILSIACPIASAQVNMGVFTNVLRTVRFDEPGVAASTVPTAAPSSPSTPPARPSAPPPAQAGFHLGIPGVRSR